MMRSVISASEQVEDVVDAGDAVVELREDFVGKVERAVLENIHLAAGEEPEVPLERLVQRADLFDLREQPRLVEAVRLEGRLRVIGDAEILQAEFLRGVGHLGERARPSLAVVWL